MSHMTILEVLKRIKHVDRKITKNKVRLARWCSYFDNELAPGEEPLYDSNKLLQSISDLLDVRAQYRHALHKANIDNQIAYKNKALTIDQILILRTHTLPATKECLMLQKRKEKNWSELRYLSEEERKDVRVVTQFDPLARDKRIDEIDNEMAQLDQILDEVNITMPTIIER